MRRSRFGRVVALLLAVSLGAFATGCFGKFQLTRKLYDINQSIDEKYVRSAATWLFVPLYGITGLLDFVDHLLEWSRNVPIYVVTLARPEFSRRVSPVETQCHASRV